MRRKMTYILIIGLLAVITLTIIYFNAIEKEPRRLVPKLQIGWERRDEFSEFSKRYGLPLVWPADLIINEKYLFAPDFSRGIQILKVALAEKIFSTSYFRKEYKDLKISYATGQGLAIKGNHLYVADSGNHRLQILKINPDGNLFAKSTFGKEGKGLGEFSSFGGLAIKGNHLYVADSGNARIQVLEIKY